MNTAQPTVSRFEKASRDRNLQIAWEVNDAFERGAVLSDNPYPLGSSDSVVWGQHYKRCEDLNQRICQQAKDAYISGQKLFDNPYDEWVIDYTMWQKGFKQAVIESMSNRLQAFKNSLFGENHE